MLDARKAETMTTMRSAELDKDTITKAYARWAPVYDLVFGAVFERGRHAAIAAAERIGGRILEVGVGTGISLPDYTRANRLCGVDISEPMLRKAQERVAELGLHQRRRPLGHGRRASVVSRTHRSTWWWRNTSSPRCPIRKPRSTNSPACSKPGGEIVLVSRVGAEAGLRRALEQWFAPAARKLGWRTEFPFERYARWAGSARHVDWSSAAPMPPFGHFSLIRFAKSRRTAPRRRGPPASASRLIALVEHAVESRPVASPHAARRFLVCHIEFIESP